MEYMESKMNDFMSVQESLPSPHQCCDDGSGGCVFPYYGLAPQVHPYANRTVFDDSLPSNFEPDEDNPNMGVYTHCLCCGRGDTQNDG